MKIKLFFVLVMTIILGVDYFALSQAAMGEEQYLLSVSGRLEIHSLEGTKLQHLSNIVDLRKWREQSGPSIDMNNGNIYFSAMDKSLRSLASSTYSINLSKDKLQPKLEIAKGEYPSVSPDGSFLAFYRFPVQLWLFNLQKQEEKLIDSNFYPDSPVVWVGNNRFLYSRAIGKQKPTLMSYDMSTGEKRHTGYKSIEPSTLSPDGKKVLCSNRFRIYLYTIETNEMELIKESKKLSIGPSFVWAPDGKRFLYTRQTWFNQLMLSEIHDLFLYSLETGEETHLLKNFTLYGGIYLPTTFGK